MQKEKKSPFKLSDNVSLKKYTTYKIGGPAKHFAEVTSKEELSELVQYLHKANERFMILGKGSNTLFDDRGYDGTVILNKIADIEWGEGYVRAGTGYSFALLGVQTARRGFAGLEFASGIPGTVGGAVFMNAGANGMEVKDVISQVEYIDEEGRFKVFDRTALSFSYRHSMFHEMDGVIVSATFFLKSSEEAKERQREILDYRMSTQPYKDKTCGCAFRNPPGDSAGRIIEACGLKGKKVGGAAVSNMHANFLVNQEGAKAKDIRALVTYIKDEVERKTGIVLHEEVRCIPFSEVNND